MIKWRDFIRLNKCLNFPQGTLLVDAVKIMKIVLRSEEIAKTYNYEDWRNII